MILGRWYPPAIPFGATEADGTEGDSYFLRVPYGLWLVGFSETPRSDAWD